MEACFTLPPEQVDVAGTGFFAETTSTFLGEAFDVSVSALDSIFFPSASASSLSSLQDAISVLVTMNPSSSCEPGQLKTSLREPFATNK
jgi:hypothetical protein